MITSIEAIYLARNNKIIIDFNESKALLIDDPLNKNQIKNNSYIILNPEINCDLLSIRYNFNNVIKSKYYKCVIPFEKYIKKKNNASNPLRRDLLRIFINRTRRCKNKLCQQICYYTSLQVWVSYLQLL